MLAAGEADIEILHEQPPASGKVIKVADGLLWGRLPLPFRLNHVNVWFLKEDDGWTAVDSGCDTEEIRANWETLLKTALGGKPLVRHVATHGHTDHIGLSGWLVERFDIPFVSTLTEWLMPQVRVLEGQGGLRPEVERHLKSLACADDMIDRLKRDRHWAGALIYPMPASLERIRNGEEVTFGKRSWRVITAGGHASEHASFYCASDNILIAGDQILPRISPMIGVWSEQPHANPLAEYLTSLDRFRSLPEDTLVLPSHGLPFLGLHRRVDQLQEHHRQRLTQLEDMMDEARNGMELATGLFKKAVHEGHARLALAETLAHINYLIADNRVLRSESKDGLLMFSRVTGKAASVAGGKAKKAAVAAKPVAKPRVAKPVARKVKAPQG
jgi:glyoxylase-like metal-dependent hydrolase (beta-lactamase superfamily II)